MRQVDYLIVGQGIAGTLLAYFLLKRNRTVLMVDLFNPSSSSMVGAGVFNPVTGRRNVKTWMMETIFPFAEETYKEMERFLDFSFYHPVNLIKIFANSQERTDWTLKTNTSELSGYMVNGEPYDLNNQWIVNDFGSIELKNTGYVNMAGLVGAFRSRMISETGLLESTFDGQDLKFSGDSIQWNNIQINKIVFCGGHKDSQNPFFSWLPFVLSKGEVLTIYAEDLNLTKILNAGIFVLPLGENKYRIGSTYTWNDLDENPTEIGKEEICKKYGQFNTCPFTILDHKAGIRPTVKDRKPLIGLHPVKRNIAIFNGLGTKGVSLAPFFAKHFVDFLEDGKPLEKVVDIERFYDLYQGISMSD